MMSLMRNAHTHKYLWLVFIVLLTVMAATPLHAQEGGVTFDEVNAVAENLYCPTCENVPLDTCGTSACIQWREEIRVQLVEGRTEQQIIDDFVSRFGDRVVGTPQDPTLRTLTLVTPWILAGLAALATGLTFIRWRGQDAPVRRRTTEATGPLSDAMPALLSDDDYRARIERDIRERR